MSKIIDKFPSICIQLTHSTQFKAFLFKFKNKSKKKFQLL